MKKILFILFAISIPVFAQLPVGTQRNSVTTDASGNVITTPITFSNQVVMVPAPTLSNNVARLMDISNFNFYTIMPVSKGGTGVSTTQLPGSWTNTIDFAVGGTNKMNGLMLQGIIGKTGTITNIGSLSTNIFMYNQGIVTNWILNP